MKSKLRQRGGSNSFNLQQRGLTGFNLCRDEVCVVRGTEQSRRGQSCVRAGARDLRKKNVGVIVIVVVSGLDSDSLVFWCWCHGACWKWMGVVEGERDMVWVVRALWSRGDTVNAGMIHRRA